MAQVSGVGTIWNLPNYSGELFTADLTMTPFLGMIGGLNGGKQTNDFEFATSSNYDFAPAAQPAITETASLTSPTATEAIRDQVTNTTQIYHEAIDISYVKLSNQNRLSGLNTQGQANNVDDERAFQTNYKLQKMARDVEYTCLNGTYQQATNAGVAAKSRGIIEACDLTGGSAVAASGAELSKALIDELLRTMFENGAMFRQPVLWGSALQVQKISDIYGFAPTDRTVGGVNVRVVVTPYGEINVAPPHRFMPSDTIVIADMAVLTGVFQPVMGKGNFFYEELSKTGASESGQLFGQFGLDHGPAFAHGKITGLATS